MATYIDALNGKHTDGSEQEETLIEITVKNIEYFTFTIPLNDFNKYKNSKEVIENEFYPDTSKKVSKDKYKVKSTRIIQN